MAWRLNQHNGILFNNHVLDHSIMLIDLTMTMEHEANGATFCLTGLVFVSYDNKITNDLGRNIQQR